MSNDTYTIGPWKPWNVAQRVKEELPELSDSELVNECYLSESDLKQPFTGIRAADGSMVATANDLFEFHTPDAKLIAAAPELLEALQKCANFIENGDTGGITFVDCRESWINAIAKATQQ